MSLLAHLPGMGVETIKKNVRAFGVYAGLGIQLGVTIVVFCFLGYFLDKHLDILHRFPFFTIAGAFIGAAASIYSIYRKVFPGDREKEE